MSYLHPIFNFQVNARRSHGLTNQKSQPSDLGARANVFRTDQRLPIVLHVSLNRERLTETSNPYGSIPPSHILAICFHPVSKLNESSYSRLGRYLVYNNTLWTDTLTMTRIVPGMLAQPRYSTRTKSVDMQAKRTSPRRPMSPSNATRQKRGRDYAHCAPPTIRWACFTTTWA